jgi:hypothetical protein
MFVGHSKEQNVFLFVGISFLKMPCNFPVSRPPWFSVGVTIFFNKTLEDVFVLAKILRLGFTLHVNTHHKQQMQSFT